ncbi:MAG: R3H domain-containing nucleic acid-binding protein [Patescibacteria group bacterium]
MDIITFLSQLAEHCGVESGEVSVTTSEDDGTFYVSLQIPEQESGRFIGHHGDSLEAIQRIARLVFQEEFKDKRLVVNINQYREDRTERLGEITQSIVERVLETGESHVFHSYLPAHERFVVHTAVGELDADGVLESVSVGEGRDRRLTIRFKDTAEALETE